MESLLRPQSTEPGPQIASGDVAATCRATHILTRMAGRYFIPFMLRIARVVVSGVPCHNAHRGNRRNRASFAAADRPGCLPVHGRCCAEGDARTVFRPEPANSPAAVPAGLAAPRTAMPRKTAFWLSLAVLFAVFDTYFTCVMPGNVSVSWTRLVVRVVLESLGAACGLLLVGGIAAIAARNKRTRRPFGN